MQDPAPENITGEKRHVFKHQINWGYIAVAVAVAVVVVEVGGLLDQGKNQDTSEYRGD